MDGRAKEIEGGDLSGIEMHITRVEDRCARCILLHYVACRHMWTSF
jgi:hypothetical protein